LLFRHKAIELGRVLQLELEEPALAGGVLVDGSRRCLEGAVGLDHVAGYGRIDLAGRLDALDHRRLVALGDGLPDIGQFHIDHVAELLLGVVGDADDPGIALDADVFVVLGVADGHTVSPLTG
jgi:hypothetical protein